MAEEGGCRPGPMMYRHQPKTTSSARQAGERFRIIAEMKSSIKYPGNAGHTLIAIDHKHGPHAPWPSAYKVGSLLERKARSFPPQPRPPKGRTTNRSRGSKTKSLNVTLILLEMVIECPFTGPRRRKVRPEMAETRGVGMLVNINKVAGSLN
jgi:hypothetical protein